MSLLTIRDLAVGYDGHKVIEHLNFTVNRGDYLCIAGENGAGKSTLMRTLLGLQPLIEGEIIKDQSLQGGSIGYLPQQTQLQKDFPASVFEVVLSGCQARCGRCPFYHKADKALARENMKRMGIESLERRCYRDLSGGQQQRVLLARALCASRELLLLDEPVSGLDPRVTEEMYQLLAELNKAGMTLIMISHDISSAALYASHILHIGHRSFFGTAREYVSSDIGRLFIAREGGDEA